MVGLPLIGNEMPIINHSFGSGDIHEGDTVMIVKDTTTRRVRITKLLSETEFQYEEIYDDGIEKFLGLYRELPDMSE